MKKVERKKERPLTQLSKSKKYTSPEKHLPLYKLMNQRQSPFEVPVPCSNSPGRLPVDSVSARQVYQTPKFQRKLKTKARTSKRSKKIEKKVLKKNRLKKKEKVHIIEDFIERSFLDTNEGKEIRTSLQENQDSDSFSYTNSEFTTFKSLDDRDPGREALVELPVPNKQSSSMFTFPFLETNPSSNFIGLQACIRRFLAQLQLQQIQKQSLCSEERLKVSYKEKHMLSLENELKEHKEWRRSFLSIINRLREFDLKQIQQIETNPAAREAFRTLLLEGYNELTTSVEQKMNRRSLEILIEDIVTVRPEKTIPLTEISCSEEPIATCLEEISLLTRIHEDKNDYVVRDSLLNPSITGEESFASSIQKDILNKFFVEIESEILIELSYIFPQVFIKDVIETARTRKMETEEMLLIPKRADHLKTLFDIREQEIGEPLIVEFNNPPVLTPANGQNRMIVDALNQCLNSFRKYGNLGEPFLWSSSTRSHSNQIDINHVLNSIKDTTFDWIASNTNDVEDQIGNLLEYDISENEFIWHELELEETQVKLDLTEIIFEDLVFEVIHLS